MISLNTQLGLDLGFTELEVDRQKAAFKPAEVKLAGGDDLPEKLLWRSGAVMLRLDKAWRVIYARGAEAVLIERAYGRGSVVVATDTFFASNEALRDERQSGLLAWLIGPSRRVIFDETHLGA